MTRPPEGQLAFYMPETVQSVVRCPTNGPLLAAAGQLWIDPEDLVVDVTSGRGNFWTHYRPARLVPHDLALDDVDFRHMVVLNGGRIVASGSLTAFRSSPDGSDK